MSDITTQSLTSLVKNIKNKKLSNGIVTVTIDEPKTYNSLSFKNLSDLFKTLQKLDKDKNVKVIILEGSGKGFSAGHNLKEVKSLKGRDKYQKLFNLCSKVMLQIVEGKKPVIAKVHGAAFAAGCQLVASCDLAYASSQSKFATPGVNIGLFCSTPMVAVSRNISNKHSMEMLLAGDLISADEAETIGLINKSIAAPLLKAKTLEIAKKISKKSALTLKIGKEAFYRQINMNLSDAYDYASNVMVENMLKLDAEEGIEAFINKRKPNWQDK